MKQLKQLLMVMAIALTGFTPAQAQYTHYSEWMANSRNYKVYKSGSYRTFTTSDGNSGDFWRYDDGLMYEAILDTYHRYETNTSLLEGVRDYLKWCFQGSSSPYIKNLETTTLDDMRPGRLVWKYKRTYSHSDTDYDSKYEAALSALMQTSAFANSSRVTINGSTGKGYPWQHKSNLGGQVWLDGIFMGLPFWTLAGPVIGSSRKEYSSWTTSDFFEDAVSQILKTDEKTYGDELGLWAHAWDGEGDEAWSTKNSSFTTGSNVPPHADIEKYAHDGRSSHCWGRALGWYAMAIMETMDNIQLQNGSGTYNTQINTLKPIFKKVMDKVIETRDPSSGVWYCVLDVGDNSSATSPYYRKGPKNNYLEATCSSMFAYCLLHGVAQGYLDSSYTTVAQDVYNSVVKEFIKNDSSNKKKLIRCDQVAGLGGTSTVNSITYNRDGSFAYYMLEDSIDNDSKGVGPFIWASLAAETTPYNYTISTGFPSIESNGIVQFRWSKVADNITNPSSYVSPTFTAKTSGGTTLTNSTDITFVSDNTDVATVAADGTITLAGEAGTANITATRTGGSYAGAAIYTVTTTGADTTAPTLESSTPATGATGVAVSGNIVLTFSEAVTIADASNITLTGGAGTLNTANATVDGATITIPYSGLANSTTYTLNINAGAVKDLAENTNDALSGITFTTIAADEIAPTLSNQSIDKDAINVSTSGTIVLTFSEAVTCTTNATLTPAGGGSAVNLTPTVSGSTVTYSYSGLSNETSYTFNLAANSVADLAGNKYASAISFSFTTGAAPTHGASDPATKTLNGITFLDVANTTNNTTITSTNTKCVTYGLYYLGNKWKPSWKGGSTSNFDSTGDSGDFTAQGFLSSDAPASGSSNATAAATSGIGDAKIRNADSYKHIFYVTGITGVAILNTDDKSSDNRQVYINIEEYNALGTSTTDIGTTQSTFNNSFHVTSYTAATLTADKYYKITLTGGNTSNACGKVAQIRFTQGSSTPSTPPYTVTATSNNNTWGTVTTNPTSTSKGTTVTITTSPAEGYELTSLTAKDASNNDVMITNNQFTMPASDVTVNAEFAAIPLVLGAVTFSPAGGNYSSEQNVTISATNAEEIWYSTVSQEAAVKNGANATQYTSAIHIGEGTTTLYATAYLGESTTTGNATYTVTIPDVGTGTELYTFSMNGSTINFANGDSEKFSITNNKSCEINNSNIKFRWHKDANTYGEFTLTSTNDIPIQSVKLVGTIEGGSQEYQDVTVTPNGTYDLETMTWTANSDNVTSVTFTNNYSASSNGNILISKIIVEYYAAMRTTTATIKAGKQYATFNTTMDIDFDETDGLQAFVVDNATKSSVHLTEVTVVPANTALIIKGAPNTYTLYETKKATESVSDNQLIISNSTVAADNKYYALGTVNGVQGFHRVQNGLTIPTSYVIITDQTAKSFLNFEEEENIATGIDGFATDNGFIVIDDNTPLYNLSGQRVSKSYKGIVIINGKKVLRK